MNKWIGAAVAALALSVLAGCSQTAAEPETAMSADDSPARILQQMTLEEKVGQLFVIRPDALDLTQTQELAYGLLE